MIDAINDIAETSKHSKNGRRASIPYTTVGNALALAAEHFRVLPIVAPPPPEIIGTLTKEEEKPYKKAWIKNWPLEATTDEEQIRNWKRKNPKCNWAIATGPGSGPGYGVWVLDVDGKEGKDSWQALVDKYAAGEKPVSRAVRTSPHHWQLYFLLPEGVVIPNSVGKIAPGIDVRGCLEEDGTIRAAGYAMAPGSVHPSGFVYKWVDPSVPIDYAPNWLVKLAMEAPSKRKTNGQANGRANGKLKAGIRNDTLFRQKACRYRALGMEVEAIEAALQKENERCDPPLSREEIHTIAESAAKYAPNAPMEGMVLKEDGRPRACLANAIHLLRHHGEWDGVLAFNEFALRVVTGKATPWQKPAGKDWDDGDDTLTAEWLQRHEVVVNSTVAAEAVQTVAREHSFHPVRDYLDSLRWDGTQRLGKWLVDYLGAPDTKFIRAVGKRWMVSGVARIYHPGCQADHMLVLVGPQGKLKSSTLRELFSDPFFTDHLSDLGSKDSRMELLGKWLVELSELDSVRRGEIRQVKAFVVCRFDSFRPPYGRRTGSFPRSCIFAGTCNDSEFLTDESGNRRFWPVDCGVIDIVAVRRDRDQLWAEAVAWYKEGKPWWLETAELNQLAASVQDEHFEVDPWAPIVLAWAENPSKDLVTNMPMQSEPYRVTTHDILVHALRKKVGEIERKDEMRVGAILRHDGWKVWRPGGEEVRGLRFYVPDEKGRPERWEGLTVG